MSTNVLWSVKWTVFCFNLFSVLTTLNHTSCYLYFLLASFQFISFFYVLTYFAFSKADFKKCCDPRGQCLTLITRWKHLSSWTYRQQGRFCSNPQQAEGWTRMDRMVHFFSIFNQFSNSSVVDI